MIIICQSKFINCNKILGQGVYGKSLDLPLNSVVPKTALKNKVLKKHIRERERGSEVSYQVMESHGGTLNEY